VNLPAPKSCSRRSLMQYGQSLWQSEWSYNSYQREDMVSYFKAGAFEPILSK